MKLCDYIKREETSISIAAKECGLGYEALRLYAVGKRIPRAAAMSKISNWSQGEVTPNDFFSEDAA